MCVGEGSTEFSPCSRRARFKLTHSSGIYQCSGNLGVQDFQFILFSDLIALYYTSNRFLFVCFWVMWE